MIRCASTSLKPAQASPTTVRRRSTFSGARVPSARVTDSDVCGRRDRGPALGASPRAAVAVQHVVARDFVLARAHQREFDLILHAFDVERAARWIAAQERRGYLIREIADDFAYPRRRGRRTAFDREKCLGHRNRNFAVVVRNDGAIAFDHAQLSRRGCGNRRRNGCGDGRGGVSLRHVVAALDRIRLHGCGSPLSTVLGVHVSWCVGAALSELRPDSGPVSLASAKHNPLWLPFPDARGIGNSPRLDPKPASSGDIVASADGS